MNHAPMIQTTARMNALVEQFNRESRDPFHKELSMPSPRRLHYWLCISAANADGFEGYAAALLALYRQEFPNESKP